MVKDLSNTFCICGNALDTDLSKFLTNSVALFKSASLNPCITLCDPNKAFVKVPSGVNALASLPKYLSILELL